MKWWRYLYHIHTAGRKYKVESTLLLRSSFLAEVTACKGSSTFVGIGNWWGRNLECDRNCKIVTRNQIRNDRETHWRTQENQRLQKIHHFNDISSLSNLLLLSASFLELLGTSASSRQHGLLPSSTYTRTLIPHVARRRISKHLVVYALWYVLCPQWRASTSAFICSHYQHGNEYIGIFRLKIYDCNRRPCLGKHLGNHWKLVLLLTEVESHFSNIPCANSQIGKKKPPSSFLLFFSWPRNLPLLLLPLLLPPPLLLFVCFRFALSFIEKVIWIVCYSAFIHQPP